MRAIFRLSLHQIAGRRRLFLIFLLAALPVALTAIITTFVENGSRDNTGFVNTMLDGMIIGGILPIVTMLLASASFGDEVSDRTLSYLVLKPVPRSSIVLSKLLASMIVAGPLLVISGVLTAILGQESGRATAAVGAAILMGVVTYTAIFTWAGLVSTRALGFGLIYVFLWEGLLSSFLGGIRYLSVRGYTLAILYGIDKKGFEMLSQRVIEFPAAVAGAATVAVVFFCLTVYHLRRMDVP